jgi:TRAP-type transport system periplasmic protein
MKKRAVLTVLSSLCLVFMLAAPSVAQVIKLTYADINPETGWGQTHAVKPWLKKLEEATKMRVKVDAFFSGTLAKGPDVWNAVKTGVADMAWATHGYWPDMTPLYDVISLPAFPLKSAEMGSVISQRLYEKFPAIQREFKDVHALLHMTSDPRVLITTKKQIKTMDDMKGLKVRTLGPLAIEMMKRLGAVPVTMSIADAYQSLDKGIIDGMDIGWEGALTFRLYEVVKYYNMWPLYVANNSIVMNKQKWESLPKDIQQAISSVSGEEGSRFWGKNWFDTAEQEVITQAVNKANYPMIKYIPSPEQVQEWKNTAGEPLWNDWVKKMESNGRPEAREILNTALELIKEYKQ